MRLDKLAAQMGDRLEINWRSFLLRVEPKTGDREKFIRYTQSWENPASQEPDANFTVWSSGDAQPSSSIPAHVAHKAVSIVAPDRAMDYHRRLLRAYFTENRNIANSDVLLGLVESIGVDVDAVAAVAADQRDQLTQVVIDEHNSALESQVTAVPTVVFEGTFAVPGAQPVETYARFVEQIEAVKGGR